MKLTPTLLILLISGFCWGQPRLNQNAPGMYKPDRTSIKITNFNKNKAQAELKLNYDKTFSDSDQIIVEGNLFSTVSMNFSPVPATLYSPSKRILVDINAAVKDFAGTSHEIVASKATNEAILGYRNLAYNPFDWQENSVSFYPHITASSECRNEAQYAARNVINGKTKNENHSGWEYCSWGPEKSSENWLKLDFGRLVELDQIKLFIRAEFPHDGYWKKGAIYFSDGSSEGISIKRTKEEQVFQFSARKITDFKIEFFEAQPENSWCAITELEAWGTEAMVFKNSDSWEDVLKSLAYEEGMIENNQFLWLTFEKEFPIETDWLMQDLEMDLLGFAKNQDQYKWEKLAQKIAPSVIKGKETGIDSYLNACKQRRKEFLSVLTKEYDKLVFVRNYPVVPSFFAYTEGVSDHRYEFHFTPGAQLCMLDLSKEEDNVTVLLDDPNGAIRDPDVSFDGKSILFAWKKSLYKDDYHLYEMDVDSREITQITFGKHVADYEGKYLQNGDIVFNSTRCEQTVDCWRTEVSNLYLVRRDGKYLRRIGFDQVHTPYPTVMDDGRVIYTRWDYNDRGQTFPQPLFVMNPDGTAQTELYGNNSWYPTTIVHARQIPGTRKIMATLCGHHTAQRGQLAVIDPEKGRQENKGIQLLAPERIEDPVRIDAYGQEGAQFQYPFPLSEDYFITSFEPYHTGNRQYVSSFNLYFMDKNGCRELLDSHPLFGSVQAVPLSARKVKHVKPAFVDYTKENGVYFIQNVYHGEGSKGIEPGTIEKIRVVALDFRAAPIGENHAHNVEEGVRTGNLTSTPIALGHGSWDVKRVLGEIDVEEDGSALFEVPARTPLYFQMVDTSGYVAQTMRSWSTLQPGETFSCVGCHENKNQSVPLKTRVMAMAKGVQKLNPFYGDTRGFSFRNEIQPILDKHCVQCHWDRDAKRLNKGNNSVADYAKIEVEVKAENLEKKAFSLLDIPVKEDIAKREWNDAYLNLLQAQMVSDNRSFKGEFKSELINWPGMQSVPTLLPPYYRGSATSKLMKMLKENHGEVKLSKEEFEKIACWIDLQVPYCGDYKEANTWTKEEMEVYDYYLNKRKKNEEVEKKSIEEYIQSMK